MSDLQCKYHLKCDEAINCGGAKPHRSEVCEPCPRHRDEQCCLPIEEIEKKDKELQQKRASYVQSQGR
jgi:hypothetical protein